MQVTFKDMPEIISNVGKLCTIDGLQYHLFDKNLRIGDTGASCFVIYDNTNMYHVKKINKQIVDYQEISQKPSWERNWDTLNKLMVLIQL